MFTTKSQRALSWLVLASWCASIAASIPSVSPLARTARADDKEDPIAEFAKSQNRAIGEAIQDAIPSPDAPPMLVVGQANIADDLEADEFGEELAHRIRDEGAKERIHIIHVGEHLPKNLQWIALHLQHYEIPYDIQLLKPNEIEGRLKELKATSPKLIQELSYDKETKAERRAKVNALTDLYDRANLKLRQFFGLVHDIEGMSFVVDVPRTPDVLQKDLSRAKKSALIAGSSFAGVIVLTHILKTHAPIDWFQVATTGVVLGTWVGVCAFWGRHINKVFTQGKKLIEVDRGGVRHYETRATEFSFMPWRYAMAAVTNAIILMAMNGPMGFTDTDLVTRNLFYNAVLTVSSRWKIDKYIADKTPTEKGADGKVIVRPWHWSPNTAGRVAFWWGTLLPQLKNLHLVNLSSVSNVAFNALAVFNIAWLLYDGRGIAIEKVKTIWKKLWTRPSNRAGDALTSSNTASCETALEKSYIVYR